MGTTNSTTRIEQPTQSYEAHSGGVNCLAATEDGSMFASGSDDCTIRVWLAQNPAQTEMEVFLKCHQILAGHTHYITTIVFHFDKLVSSSADQTLKKWDPNTGQCLLTLSGHDDLIDTVICSESFIFSCSNDKSAICWDFEDGRLVHRLKGHTHRVSSIGYFHSVVQTLKTTSQDQTNNGQVLKSRDCIYTGSADRTAKAWSSRSGKCILTFKGHTGAVTQLRINKSGTTLYTASLDGTLRSWFAESGQIEFIFQGHKAEIVWIELSDKTIYSSSTDRTARSWLLSTGAPIRKYHGATRTVNKVKNLDNHLITSSDDGHVRWYDERTGKLNYVFGNKFFFCCNAFLLTDNYAITTANDGILHLWDTRITRDCAKEQPPIENDKKITGPGDRK